MTSKHTELQAIAQLEQSTFNTSTGALLAKKYDRLLKRQQGEIRQLQGLRWALDLVPQGAARAAVAAQILQATTEHARLAERLARDIAKESTLARRH